MESKNKEDYDKLKHEENVDWWRPTKEDGYSLEKKLFRTGCRGIQRRYLECTRSENVEFKVCLELEKEFTKCRQLLMFLYQTKGDLDN